MRLPPARNCARSGRRELTTAPGAAGNSDIETLKYDPSGQPTWTRRYDGPGRGDDETFGVEAVGLDSIGRVYVCGYAYAADGMWE